MVEQPILFNGTMVRAILDGRKTQTRRVVKMPPAFDFTGGLGDDPSDPKHWGAEDENALWWALAAGDDVDRVLACPFGQPGDRLWVREAHSIFPAHGQHRADGGRWGPWAGLPTTVSEDGKQIAYYREGFDRCDPGRWRPSIHMPRWACRLVLEITNVRVERLQAISEADALAEGIERFATVGGTACKDYSGGDGFNVRDAGSIQRSFRSLWTSTGGDWDANPWVWVISFKRIDSPHEAVL
ncbi:hypothetical protein [Stenotrophomonas sp. PS02298]|uniref:hypothetical protein n=1 Tax=Stenotrophomonas sp. PS02298 TaxID=2991424 RepID=UPI00249AFC44|nr:hypothetical protein [Stenotrophomonas sp. PS02298]